ncbi:MAG: YhjD/YihY/BrkB family envelope integrity protein [bacterium]
MNTAKKIKSIINFIKTDLWISDLRQLSRIKKLLLNLLKMAVIVTKGFIQDNLTLRSSALTFATILGIVPFFALMFSLLKGFGVHNFFEPIIFNRVAIGTQGIVKGVFEYINNTSVKTLGAGGLIILIFTVLYVIENVELSFNTIWGIKKRRNFFRRFSDFFTVIIMGPVFVFAAVSFTTTFKIEGTVLLEKLAKLGYFPYLFVTMKSFFPKFFQLIPYIFMWGLFTFIYMFIPNTKVKFSAAFVGGIIGGTLWQIVSGVYINFQFSVGTYNALYGAMAQLPILLVWIYISWIIILFGAEVSFAFQNLQTFEWESQSLNLSQTQKEMLALRVSFLIARNFLKGEAVNAQIVSAELNIPVRLVNEILYELSKASIFIEANSGQSTFVPTRDLERIALADIIQALRNFTGGEVPFVKEIKTDYIAEIEAKLNKSLYAGLGNVSLRDAVKDMSK